MGPQLYRQGDVLLIAVDQVPARAKKTRPRAKLVLAEGEMTGHAHVLDAPEVEEYVTETDERFIRIMDFNGLLTHEEHTTLTIPPGDYQVLRQREYAPEAPRQVAD